ncbi:hypothetical protein SBDP1_500044 [Syntrophobacter sp. SbD1]|nr:hypothetical protein SBDP1_500044 [Syntrophobacter sp. SbD1]
MAQVAPDAAKSSRNAAAGCVGALTESGAFPDITNERTRIQIAAPVKAGVKPFCLDLGGAK